jgi:hypothetical protein
MRSPPMGKNLRQQPLRRPAQPRLPSRSERERHSEQAADQHNDGHARSPVGEETVNTASNQKAPRKPTKWRNTGLWGAKSGHARARRHPSLDHAAFWPGMKRFGATRTCPHSPAVAVRLGHSLSTVSCASRITSAFSTERLTSRLAGNSPNSCKQLVASSSSFRGAFSSRELSRDPPVNHRRREQPLPAFRVLRQFWQ